MNALGFGYQHKPQPAPNAQDYARRATLEQFQGYPANEISGAGTLVSQNGVNGGKYWRINQPPQVFANHTGVMDSLLAGGTNAGTIYGAPLVANPDSNGLA